MVPFPKPLSEPVSNLRAYLELFRLPNVFTAMADILLGFFVTHQMTEAGGHEWFVLALLLVASSLLYTAGMVLNDVFDMEVDARQRPQRPLPSGRIAPRWARSLGLAMLLAGAAVGWMASAVSWQLAGGVVASLLALAVWLYDSVLKRTPTAPLAMGACRFLNVLLGMSAAGPPGHVMLWVLAAGVGVYVVGVTWFARTEALDSNRGQLALATVVLLAGIWLLAWYPSWRDETVSRTTWPGFALALGERWHLLWGVLGMLIGWRCLAAVIDPAPAAVQAAVRQAIFSLIVLDAAACLGIRGVAPWALIILVLLAPTMLLGRWIYST